ncbi:aminomethyl-transferring glycine dehydrogenase subunit GcvPA [bacterium]|nr:aminomethyl-transferring glycine dehydrogenase subunit GcvPA [bacterium]
MPYLYNTAEQRTAMLDRIGVDSVATLLEQIPQALQLHRPLDLPAPLTEIALEQRLRQLADRSTGAADRVCFLGGGAYEHFIPSVIDELTGRGEFYTAYTPYQAEASQGTLQAFFEFQSLICELTEMDVSNASVYDGASAIAEAVLMSMRVTGRKSRVVFAGAVHPESISTVRTYVQHLGCEVVCTPLSAGVIDRDQLSAALTDQTACVIVQSPNFLGGIEDVTAISELAHKAGALCVQSFNPISLGLLKRPGACGVDIAVAEGQSLGIPLQFGGPYLGLFTCRSEHVRKLPGRLIGETVDRQGKRCFVLNLQAREQHIRRDKATSNICTNQGLMALRATIYLATLGPQGIREVAELCCQKAHYAAKQLAQVAGLPLMSTAPFFQEFAVRCTDPAAVITKAQQAGFDVGPLLSRFAPISGLSVEDQAQGLLVAVTECRSRDEIDRLVEVLA